MFNIVLFPEPDLPMIDTIDFSGIEIVKLLIIFLPL